MERKKNRIEADLCVVGGGIAGVCAAVAAARLGARVVLLQDRSVLGGNASSEIRMHIVGADCHGSRPGARETGLLEELRLEDAVRNPQRSFPQWDLLLYEMVVEEPGITLLLNTVCTGCSLEEGGAIGTVEAVRHGTEEAFTISARFFADCSGDGRLGMEAGADFRMGREAVAEFGETLALPEADARTLGSSILFSAKEHPTPQPYLAPSWTRKFTKPEFKRRGIAGGYEYGFWWLEWGGQFDTIADSDKIRHELLRIALGIWDYIKNSGEHPDSANWALEWIGSVPGKRESRRFLGPHVLTQSDIETGRLFEDRVAYGGWWLDLHPPSGVDAIDEDPCVQHHIPHLYGIPLRALHSRNVPNLFFAGRNVSATHVAFASTRVMGTCAVMGQAVGTAAALLLGRRGSIAELSTPETLSAIQQALLKEDAYLPGIEADRFGDLALSARLSASGWTPGREASNVLNGTARRVEAAWTPGGVASENVWEASAFPGFLQFDWEAPQEIGALHLTFCTGLARELTLSPSDKLTRKMVRGPQPETVRDYDIVADGKTVLQVRGNYQRKRRHGLRLGGIRSLRIEFLAGQAGVEGPVRVYETRILPPTP